MTQAIVPCRWRRDDFSGFFLSALSLPVEIFRRQNILTLYESNSQTYTIVYSKEAIQKPKISGCKISCPVLTSLVSLVSINSLYKVYLFHKMFAHFGPQDLKGMSGGMKPTTTSTVQTKKPRTG